MAETSTDATGVGFPSPERPNNQKDHKYILANIRQMNRGNELMIAQWGSRFDDNTGKVVPIWGMYEKARLTRLWSRGLEDVTIHKTVHALTEPTAAGIETGRVMNWDMPRYHVQLMNRLRNILTNWDTSPVVKVMNQQAVDAHMEEQMLELAGASMNVDPMLQDANAAMGADIKPPAMSPQTPGEWDVMSRMGFKMKSAMVVRRTVDHVKELNRYMQELRPAIANALIDDGIVVMTSRRGNRGLPVLRVIPFEMCYIPRTNNNFNDLARFGWYEWLTPTQIFAEMGKECTPDVRRRITKMATMQPASFFQSGYAGTRGYLINPNATEMGVKVFRGMFKDYNIIETATRKSDGIMKETHEWGEEELDPSLYDLERTTFEVCYEGSYLVGTINGPATDSYPDGEIDHTKDMGCIYWGCGMCYSQARMRGSLRGVRLPVAIGVYNMTDMTLESIGSMMRAAYYNVIRASLELRALIVKIIPPYIAIEEEFLDGVTSHDGTGQAKRTDIIRVWRQDGTLVINSRNPEDRDSGLRGFETGIKIDGGFIPEFERLSNLIDSEMRRFKECGGFNDANDGGTMDDRLAVHNAVEMRKTQAKALKPITDCMNYAEGILSEIIYAQLSATLASGNEIEWLGPFMGDATAAMVRLTAENDPLNIGITVKQMSTEEERMNFNETLQAALANGEITADEKFICEGIEDKQEAAAMLRILSERRADKRQQEQMALVQQQGESAKVAAQMGTDGRMAEIVAESEARIKEMGLKSQLDQKAAMDKHAMEIEKLTETHARQAEIKQAEILASLHSIQEQLASKERIAEGVNKTKVDTTDTLVATDLETTRMMTEAQEEIAEKNAQAAKNRPAAKK